MEHIHLADIRFLHGHQWTVYKSPGLGALKPISPVCARLNQAAPNANCITLYRFPFNDFVTPLTVLYKSSAGWFVQGPPLDKLVWLQCSAAPCVCVSLSLARSPLQRDSLRTQQCLSLPRWCRGKNRFTDWWFGWWTVTEPLNGGLHTDSFLLANSVPPAPLSESDARRAAVKELLLGSQRRRYSKGSVLTVGVSRAFASSHNAILPTDEWVASQINLRDLKTSKVHSVSYFKERDERKAT